MMMAERYNMIKVEELLLIGTAQYWLRKTQPTIEEISGLITNSCGNMSHKGLLQKLLKQIIEGRKTGLKAYTIGILINPYSFDGGKTDNTFDLGALLETKFPTQYLQDLQTILNDDEEQPVTSFWKRLLTYIIYLDLSSGKPTVNWLRKITKMMINIQTGEITDIETKIEIEDIYTKEKNNNVTTISIRFDCRGAGEAFIEATRGLDCDYYKIEPLYLTRSCSAMEASDVSEMREIKVSPEITREILHIIQLGLSEYSANENLPRPLKVTIDISTINKFVEINLPEEHSDTVSLTLEGKYYLKCIIAHIRKYIQQDSDAEVELHSRLGSYTEHMEDKDDVYNVLINNIFIIFYDRIKNYIICECINKTPYLKEFFESCESKEINIYSTIEFTSANHRDNNVFMKFGIGGLSTIPQRDCTVSFLKSQLAFKAPTIELREKILSIDDDILEYIRSEIQGDDADYYEDW